jgi:hypothetical protein
MFKYLREFRRRNTIELLVVTGFAGFVTGCLLLFSSELIKNDKKSVFHEIVYNPRQILQQLIAAELSSLSTTGDSAVLSYQQKLEKLSKQVNETGDSVFLEYIHLHLTSPADADTLQYLENATRTNDSLTAPIIWLFRDSSMKLNLHSAIRMPVKNFSSNVDFFNKYPGFAIWALLIVSFFTTLFIIAAVSNFTRSEVREKIKFCLPNPLATKKYRFHYAIAITILAVFAYISLKTFYDGSIVKNIYFLHGLRTKILILAVLAYIVSSFCFSGFINTASYLEQLHHEFIHKIKEDSNNKALLQKISFCHTVLKNHFDTFFICTSIILSFVVFCTGALYSAVNTMDFVKKLTYDMGYSPVRHDFVFVYGGLHTLLILIFYIPVKLKFANFENDIETYEGDDDEATREAKATSKSLFAGPFKKVTDVLIAGSPILAGFMQALLDYLFGN